MPLLWPQNWLTPSMINSRLICSPIHFLVPFKKILRHACSLSSWNVGPTFHFNSIFPGRCSSLENSGGWGQTRIAADCNNFRNQGLNKRRPRAQSQMWSSSLFPLCLQPYTHMDFAHHTYKDFAGESLNRKRGSFVRQLCTDYRTKITECPQKKT